MELDKLIEELKDVADFANTYSLQISAKGDVEMIVRKAAETIKLMRECIVEEDNEKWHRMIDDMEKKDE